VYRAGMPWDAIISEKNLDIHQEAFSNPLGSLSKLMHCIGKKTTISSAPDPSYDLIGFQSTKAMNTMQALSLSI
jgi:hypothetical protein